MILENFSETVVISRKGETEEFANASKQEKKTR